MGFLQIGKDTAATAKALTADLQDALRWGEENAVTFAPDKFELIHFTEGEGR